MLDEVTIYDFAYFHKHVMAFGMSGFSNGKTTFFT